MGSSWSAVFDCDFIDIFDHVLPLVHLFQVIFSMASTSSSSSPSSISSGNPCQANKVWIGNLDPKVTEYQLLKVNLHLRVS